MPRMKDCRECAANDIPREEWSIEDGPYPVVTPREARKEHSYCGIRMGGGAHWEGAMTTMMWRPNGQYVGVLIHKGRKPVR